MAKIVYNQNYGGFGLSDEACEKMLKLGSPYVSPYDEPFVNMSYYVSDDIPRHDAILISVVEEIGLERASGVCANLAITEVEGPYHIRDYDGWEFVETPETITWITPS